MKRLMCLLASAVSYSSAFALLSYNWDSVPSYDNYDSSDRIGRNESAQSFCAMALGIADCVAFQKGNANSVLVKANDYGFFTNAMYSGSNDLPLVKSSLRKSAYNDFLGIFSYTGQSSTFENCTCLGLSFDGIASKDVCGSGVTSAIAVDHIDTCTGSSLIPQIRPKIEPAKQMALAVNSVRSMCGFPILQSTYSQHDLTAFFNEASTSSLRSNVSNDFRVISDKWQVPVSDIFTRLSKLSYLYDGHKEYDVERRSYSYGYRVEYSYDVIETNGEIVVSFYDPDTYVERSVDTTTNSFGYSEKVTVGRSYATPAGVSPAVQVLEVYEDGSPPGIVTNSFIYCRGGWMRSILNVDPIIWIDYFQTRERLLKNSARTVCEPRVNFSKWEPVQNSLPLDYNVSSRSYMSVDTKIENVRQTFYRTQSYSSYGMYGAVYAPEEILVDTLDEYMWRMWIDLEKNPTARLKEREYRIETGFSSLQYTVYSSDGQFIIGWAVDLGGAVTQDRPTERTYFHSMQTEIDFDGLPSGDINEFVKFDLMNLGDIENMSSNLQQ